LRDGAAIAPSLSEVTSMWSENPTPPAPKPDRRHSAHFAISAFSVLVCALLIAGLAWYAYPILQRRDANLKDLPSLKDRVSTLGDQLKQAGENADRKFAAWTRQQAADHRTLRQESADMARDLKARIEMAQAKFEQVGAELSEKMDRAVTRIATLESSRQSDQQQLATLEQRIDAQDANLADVRAQLQDDSANAQEQIAALKQDQDLSRHDIGAIENKLAVDKISFEASKGRTQELAPGITLYLSGTDTNYRRADGWLWLAEDRRNIWLRDLAAQQPLTFYGYQDGQKRELVITNVTAGSVSGYLLLPKESVEAPRAEAGQ
jgi:hypothetical protein